MSSRPSEPTELSNYVNSTKPHPLLLDVREPWEYDICHLEDSTLIPIGKLQQSLNRLDQMQETVVICHHGIRSLQVARYLESIGFQQIINLEGGIDAWSKEVDQAVPTY